MERVRLIATAVVCCIAGSANICAAGCPPLLTSNHRTAENGPLAYTVTGPLKKSERSRRHIPVPEGSLDSVRILLERSECEGSCPSYSIELRGDGSAIYTGKAFVLVPGRYIYEVSPQNVRCLVAQFRAADFWSLNSSYEAPVIDSPAYSVTLEIGGAKKTVADNVGRAVGMPKAVTALEDEIDGNGLNRWVYGDSETLPSLRREHFDFHSDDAATILANAAGSGSEEFVLGLLAEGAPATGRQSYFRQTGAAAAAASEGRSSIVRLLLAAGADPNLQNADGSTALHWASNADIVQLLVKAGANPEIKDEQGLTPLLFTRDDDASIALIEAGADITAKTNSGATVEQHAIEYKLARTLDLLRSRQGEK
jgi:hypothetical protein